MEVKQKDLSEDKEVSPLEEKAEEPSPEKSNSTSTKNDSKKAKKDDRSKRDEKGVDQVMKSLNSVPSLEEKLLLLCKKYVMMCDENKKLQMYMKHSDKRHMLITKEMEHLQHEHNKTVLVKSRLEDLCRELQKQNKAIKEESLVKIREEEERRKETQGKFQTALAEISALLQQNNEKNCRLRDDNAAITDKFKGILNQYALREQQVEKLTKQMALENQLADTKMQKANLEHQAEKNRLLAEIETLKMSVSAGEARAEQLRGAEAGLRAQLALYTDKYDEFQAALTKSNNVFTNFKHEMDKMSKKMVVVEGEALQWKRRWEAAQAALLEAAAVSRQLASMQALCRALQAERAVLVATLKEHDIERPPAPPAAPPAPPAPPAQPDNNDKVEAMAANCAQLKQSLAQLKSQLNVLTNNDGNEQQPNDEHKKTDKRKKGKKNKPLQHEYEETLAEKARVQKETEEAEKEMNQLIYAVNAAKAGKSKSNRKKTVIQEPTKQNAAKATAVVEAKSEAEAVTEAELVVEPTPATEAEPVTEATCATEAQAVEGVEGVEATADVSLVCGGEDEPPVLEDKPLAEHARPTPAT